MENLTRITIPTALPANAELPTSPHFDDEATLLTARPVVPLNAGLRWDGIRNYVLTALILLTAALVGAVAALSIDRFQNASQTHASVAEETPAATQLPEDSPAVTEATAGQETAVLPPVAQPTATPETEPKIKPVAPPKASAPAVKSAKPAPRNNRLEERMALSEPTRLERLGERRRRRVESGRSARSRDVNRIREIFEGPGRF